MKPKDVTSHHDPMGGFCGSGGGNDEDDDDDDEDRFIPSDDLNINCSIKGEKNINFLKSHFQLPKKTKFGSAKA